MTESKERCLSSSDIEYVEVQIKIPKPMFDFLRALTKFYKIELRQFIEEELKVSIRSILDGLSGSYKQELIERYGLKDIV